MDSAGMGVGRAEIVAGLRKILPARLCFTAGGGGQKALASPSSAMTEFVGSSGRNGGASRFNYSIDENMNEAFNEARALYSRGDLAGCLEACETILEADPANAQALHLVGLLCYRGGDVETAITFFQECLTHHPDFAEAYCNLAAMLKKQGRTAESLEAYRQGLALDPDDAQGQYNYGVGLQAANRFDEAAQALRRAVALSPYMPDAHNALGLAERALGNAEAAVISFRNGIASQPEALPAYRNMAATLRQLGRPAEAVMTLRWAVNMHGLELAGRDLAAALDEAGLRGEAELTLKRLVARSPADAAAWEALGALHMRMGQYPRALDELRRATMLDDTLTGAHMRIYCVAQILHQPEVALEHQRHALKVTRLFSDTSADTNLPKLLILNAAGDYKANVPTDFIVVRDAWQAVHQYYVTDDGSFDLADLPACDVVFSAVAEPDVVRAAFGTAAAIVDALGLPCVNDPRKVARTERQMVAEALAGLPSTVVPATFRLRAETAVPEIASLLEQGRLHWPLIVRPVGTHAGEGMVLLADTAAVVQAVEAIGSGDLYVLQFINYRNADSLYRKYRVVVVDGVSYPFHMGLSNNWIVHYYNAELDDKSVMDREEEHFLSDFSSVFSPALQADLAEMGRRLGLDYFAVDCSIDDQGRLVLFEVDVGAVIHTFDDPKLYAYKHRYVPRIYDAVQAMLKSRIR
jgi:tetratricopeptide (TPR) repeat protein